MTLSGKHRGRIEVGGRTVLVPDAERMPHYAHLVLVNAAAACSNALVLHGAAVVQDGKAAVVLAPSGGGKTTIALELVRRGWRFLSDDFAVLASDSTVLPFPRRVNLTDDTIALLRLPRARGSVPVPGPSGRVKWMTDIEGLFPGALGTAAPLRSLFLFTAVTHTSTSSSTRDPDTKWRLELDHLPLELEARLTSLPGVTEVHVLRRYAPPLVEITGAPGEPIVAALDEACAKTGVSLLGTTRGNPRACTFDRTPEASSANLMSTVPQILVHDLSLSGSRFLHGTEAATVQLAYAKVIRCLSNNGRPVSIYFVRPGTVGATADLIEKLHARAIGSV